MTVDEVNDLIVANDTINLEIYLKTLTGTNAQLDKIKSFAFYSILKNRIDCLKLFIKYKADITFPQDWALIYARERGSLEIYNYILTGK